MEVFDADAKCAVSVLDATGNRVRTAFSPSLPSRFLSVVQNALLSMPQGACATALRSGQTATCADMVVATLACDARPTLSLALEVVRRGPFKIARFAGGRHANGNFAAADPRLLSAIDGQALRDAAMKGIPLSGKTLANCIRVTQRSPPVVVGSIERAVEDHDREREAGRARYAAGNE